MTRAKRAIEGVRAPVGMSDSERSAYFEQMLRLSPAVIYGCGPGPEYAINYISHNVIDQIGLAPSDFYGDPFSWSKLIHPDDSARILDQLSRIEEVDHIAYEYRLRHLEGHYIWAHDQMSAVRDTSGAVTMLVGCWMDITDRKRVETEQAGQHRVLATLATGSSLDTVLSELVNVTEAQAPGMQCAVAIYDPDHRCLRHWVAPSLPRAYSDAIDGLKIGPSVGSCGTAAFRRERVVVECVDTDPLWEDYRHIAQHYGLRACWSQPVLSPEGHLLGTFAMYYRNPRAPTAEELKLIEHASRIAAIAIEYKKKDESLRASEARYQDLYEHAPDMFASVDAKSGRVLQCNDTLAYATGFAKSEIVGRQVADICDPACENALRAALTLLARTGEVRDAELRLKCKDASGIDVSLNVSAVRDDGGGIVYCRTVWRDITERKRNEAALQEHTRLTEFGADIREAFGHKRSVKDILQQCTEAMVRHLDAAFARIWTLNTAADELELQASAGIYTHIDGIHGRIGIGEFKIGAIAQEGQPHLTNTVIGDPCIHDQAWAKREGMIAFAGYPLIIEERVVGVMALFSRNELTERALTSMAAVAEVIALGIGRKRAEEALQRSERLASIGTLAAGIAHEINNPIAAILLAARRAIAHKKIPNRKDLVECLEGVVADADRCARIITNVLRFSRTGATERWPSRVEEILRQAIELSQAGADKRGAVLELQVERDLPKLAVNASQLVQVFVNLISNAVEAGDRSNRVLVCASREPGTLHVAVTDSGCGMTPEQRKHLFDPFYTTREREGGTGLGLSIAHGIVLSHGGTIDVESEPGQGTCMKVKLPLDNRFGSGEQLPITRT